MASIREIDIERDAADLVALHRQAFPTAVVTVPSFVHRQRSVPERARARGWVAEDDGRAVGRVECWLNFFTAVSRAAFLHVAVDEHHRRRGVGAALYERGLAYVGTLGPDSILANFHENDAGVAFAAARGFALERAEIEASLDPRDVTEQPDPGVDLQPVAAVDPRLVHVVDAEATVDVPSTEQADVMAYDEWERHVLDHPLFTQAGSFVAMADGVAAAISMLTVDPETGRAANWFTGTLRAYRGRGLARAVKLASIHWAAANGVTQLATYNDETNAAMLAINRRLGYRPCGRRVEYVRAMGTTSSPAPPAPAT